MLMLHFNIRYLLHYRLLRIGTCNTLHTTSYMYKGKNTYVQNAIKPKTNVYGGVTPLTTRNQCEKLSGFRPNEISDQSILITVSSLDKLCYCPLALRPHLNIPSYILFDHIYSMSKAFLKRSCLSSIFSLSETAEKLNPKLFQYAHSRISIPIPVRIVI
jgi:hypothetical protein